MLQLYSYYRSPAAYRVRIALHVKGLEFKYHGVHPVKTEGAAEYRKLNPQGLVPALVDGKITVTQSLAIMEYLEEKYPEPRILPKKTAERAFVRQLANIIVSDIHPLSTLRVFNHLSGEFSIQQAQKTAWHHKWLQQGFDALEKLLDKNPLRTGPYCCGDEVTIADMCLIPQLYDAHRYEMPLANWPVIAEIEKNCLKLKSFQDAAPENQPDTPEDHRPVIAKGKS